MEILIKFSLKNREDGGGGRSRALNLLQVWYEEIALSRKRRGSFDRNGFRDEGAAETNSRIDSQSIGHVEDTKISAFSAASIKLGKY